MISLKQIMVPTDFSEPSQSALLYGKALAQTFQATLHLVHVVEESALAYTFASPEGSLVLPNLQEELTAGARRQLETVLSSAERKELKAEVVLLNGSPFVEIVRYAKSKSIDLIVIGTHGRGPIAHMLMGSVAERVVRKAPCPVLTVRSPEHEFVMP